jgi:hypothetical protein
MFTEQQAQIRARLRAPGDPWDSARYREPDPAWPPARQLAWYRYAFAELARHAYPDDVQKIARLADRQALT